MFKKIILTSTLFIFTVLLHAQTGKIAGKIVDAKTGETLPGATVLIEGTTKGASSDFDGNFSLAGLEPGKYTIIASYITYDSKKFVDVVVKANEVTDFSITLDQSSSQTLNEVVVQAEMNKENTNTLLVMQKNNASVSDGISSESIKKTPDRSTSDVIKRISGATIQDNKFAIIRGMSDRYNAGFINGAPLPSSESDKKAFSFDMFPANILDNIVILKTATPDQTGEFAGGIIQINTKSIPEKNSLSFAIGAGYNPQTTFKDFKTYQGGKMDWIGMDDGTRALPKGLPNPAFTTDKNQQIENAKLFNYDWSLKNRTAMPNINIQGTMANIGKLFKRELGSVFAITYNSNINTTFTDRKTYSDEGSNTDLVKLSNVRDTTNSQVILASALWNLSYKIHPNHQIGFKNLYSINSEDKVVSRTGITDYTNNVKEKSSVRWFTQNNIYSGQLNGDHYIEKAKLKIKWIGGYSDIQREIPNLRRMRRYKAADSDDDVADPYKAAIGSQGTSPTSAGSMLFLKTLESMKSMRYDISRAFTIGKTKHELQIGGSHIFRQRTFSARLLGYNSYTFGSKIVPNQDVLLLSDADIFNSENIGVLNIPGTTRAKGGFVVVESTTPSDSYYASSMTNAGYIMGDSRFFDSKLRLIYGARVESYRQILSGVLYGEQTTKDTTVIDVLPSANLVYSLTDKINIRLAYFKTVARPEFRELSPFQFQDFTTSFVTSGNPDLKRSKIDNYDIRFEWFPGAGQIVSVSGFYKKIENAIEQVMDKGFAGGYATNYANSKSAQNIGAELEYRFKLSTIFNADSSKFLSNTTLFSNFAYIQSKVDNTNTNGGEIRPLQGQSPYIINAGLQYLDNEKNWGVSISYNLIGRRIVIVGSPDVTPSIWENPRHVLDFQVSKTFMKRLDVKLNLRDALAQRQIWYQDVDKNGKITKGSMSENNNLTHSHQYDNIFMSTKLAPTISISLSYKIY
ncbi:MAG: TonB-dependent receptor [Bacteroidetes bacterium]|nr:TonB-dependent receptor [Bacteroidota bacterium]